MDNNNNYSKPRFERVEKPYFTPDILSDYLKCEGIRAMYNELEKRPVFVGAERENPEFIADNIVALLYSELQGCFRGVTVNSVAAYLDIVVSRNSYNPVTDMLLFTEWDGIDRLEQVYDILGLPESDKLSRILVRKWLLQTLCLQYNSVEKPFGADGVLCLTGPQGIGKTSFFRRIAAEPCFFKEGVSIDFSDKDSYIRALSGWICELGEVESTLRRDIEKLKAFVTQAVDEYRKPYGRSSVRTLRRTSLCATSNSEQFLLDCTGNRRFWTVPVKKIDLEALREFDSWQLWAQLSREILSDKQCFRLTIEEQRELNERNSNHEKPMTAQSELEDILNDDGEGKAYIVRYKLMTVSEFKSNYDSLKSYSVKSISDALTRLGVETKRVRTKNGTQRMRLLPVRIYNKYDYD